VKNSEIGVMPPNGWTREDHGNRVLNTWGSGEYPAPVRRTRTLDNTGRKSFMAPQLKRKVWAYLARRKTEGDCSITVAENSAGRIMNGAPDWGGGLIIALTLGSRWGPDHLLITLPMQRKAPIKNHREMHG